MKGHCACLATGRSSHAIARKLGHCTSGGTEHPLDPADLLRCIEYVQDLGVTSERLAEMAEVSPQWAIVVEHWDELCALLSREMDDNTGRAPLTYRRMNALHL